MDWGAMASVGRIARAHGLRGQVIVTPDTDFPEERFRAGAELFMVRAGTVESVRLTSARFQNNRPVIGIAGVDTVDQACELAGLELKVPVEQLVTLPADTFFRHDLIGCAVELKTGEAVGVVAEVEGSMTGSRLVVSAATGEVLIPLTLAICTSIDPASKRIVIDPPPGLLELNVTRRTERASRER